MHTVNAIGKSCPEPVILTKEALEEFNVDDAICRDNVERFAKTQGCTVTIKEKDKEIHLTIQRTQKQAVSLENQEEKKKSITNTVFYIASDQMGIGVEDLGHILMRAFIKTIKDLKKKPEKLIFVNSGVKLSTKGSKVISDLQELQKSGITILSCGTCLDFYGLKEDLEVGNISNMFEILSSLEKADKVIRP